MAKPSWACFRLPVAAKSPPTRPDPSVEPPRDPRIREVVIGGLVIVTLGAGVCLLVIARLMPGFLGESFAMLGGIVSTPFLMEASFVALGLTVVVAINLLRQKRDGDEFVYLERAEGPGSEELPDQARWAIYRDEPLPPPADDPLAEIEGAISIGDHEAACEKIASLPVEQQGSREVIVLRLRLARESGRDKLAGELEARLKELAEEG